MTCPGVNDVQPVGINDVRPVGNAVYPQGGYICPSCGTWVGPYVAHACTGADRQPIMQPWQWPSKTTTCDHCYCQQAASDDHKLCCKCSDTRLEKFVGNDGR